MLYVCCILTINLQFKHDVLLTTLSLQFIILNLKKLIIFNSRDSKNTNQKEFWQPLGSRSDGLISFGFLSLQKTLYFFLPPDNESVERVQTSACNKTKQLALEQDTAFISFSPEKQIHPFLSTTTCA